jgi:hypothetical protein
MPTTFATVRDKMVTLLEGLTPLRNAAQPFRRHRDPADFSAWVEAHPEACLRRFELETALALEPAPFTDGLVENTEQVVRVRVAYPRSPGLYGPENERDHEDLLEVDVAQIDEAIGKHAGPDYVNEQHECAFRALAIDDAGEAARILSLTYSVQFNRSV